jgi:high-affinity Fe2+/Pb2+ permease
MLDDSHSSSLYSHIVLQNSHKYSSSTSILFLLQYFSLLLPLAILLFFFYGSCNLPLLPALPATATVLSKATVTLSVG